MKVIKLGNDIKTTKHQCNTCKSLLSYTQYDIHTHKGDWHRVGIERSVCSCHSYMTCPVCHTNIVLKSWTEEF